MNTTKTARANRFLATKFYVIDLDRRMIRAKHYPSERAAVQDGSRLTFRGSHLARTALYASFALVDDATWAA